MDEYNDILSKNRYFVCLGNDHRKSNVKSHRYTRSYFTGNNESDR